MAKEPVLTAEERIAQLEKQLAEAEKQNKEKDQLLVEKAQEIRQIKAEGAGWLVTTPNPLYDGSMAGITFINGTAFIPVGRKVKFYEAEPIKESTMDKAGYTPAERKAIREREKLSSAERAAAAFQGDFGYQVEFFDGESVAALKERLSKRAAERQALEALQDRLAEQTKTTVRPHFV